MRSRGTIGSSSLHRSFANPLPTRRSTKARSTRCSCPAGMTKGCGLTSKTSELKSHVARFFAEENVVAAFCHGTLLAARSHVGERSVLWGRKTTGLTRRQELTAWWLTRATLGDYYRTYPMPMADELVSLLRSPDDYDPGPGYPIPLARDSDEHPEDRVHRSRRQLPIRTRWPGDADTDSRRSCFGCSKPNRGCGLPDAFFLQIESGATEKNFRPKSLFFASGNNRRACNVWVAAASRITADPLDVIHDAFHAVVKVLFGREQAQRDDERGRPQSRKTNQAESVTSRSSSSSRVHASSDFTAGRCATADQPPSTRRGVSALPVASRVRVAWFAAMRP